MGRKKFNKILSVFAVFFKSIKVYFMYLDKTAKYMSIPIMGQILGITLIFISAYYFNANIKNIVKIPFFANNSENLIFGLLIVLLPFLALYLYSFYKYIIAFCSLNIVFYTLASKKRVKEIDFDSSDKYIERRLFQYILLMTLISVLCIFPPLWIVLCLSFQIFSLESDSNFLKAAARSLKLTLENILAVILMLVMVFLLTYWFLPSLFLWSLEKTPFINFLITHLEVYMRILPFVQWNNILSVFSVHIDSITVAKSVTELILTSIIIGYTLPFRCACFTELYRILDNEQIREFSKEDEEIIRRASSKKRKNK